MAVLSDIFDVTLLATVGLIFLVTLVGAYLRSRQRDRCLESFDGFHVTVERADGKVVWGVMELAPTGLELRYRNTVQDANHIESSYVFYASEYTDIQAIYRYVDQLTPEEQTRRAKDMARSFHPGPLRRMGRSLRHFIATASESLTEVVGLVAGRLKRPAGRYIDDAGAEQLTSLGQTVIGSVGHLHDPLLERYIGQKVVVEIAEGDEVHENVGIFKNYSPDFIELLDVQSPRQEAVNLNEAGQGAQKRVQILRQEDALQVCNQGEQPLLLHSVSTREAEELLNVVVDVGETVELHLPKELLQGNLNLRVVRELDLIVPRTRCLVRHRAEHSTPEMLPDIIFDIGIALKGNSLREARELRLRRQLADNPRQTTAAVNLASLLMQKQAFDEAEILLEQALRMPFSLPDNGRRAQMLWRECQRRRSKSNRHYTLLTPSQTFTARPALLTTRAQVQNGATALHQEGNSLI